MSEIIVLAIRLGFLALMWLFVLMAANTIRGDLFGRAVPSSSLPTEEPARFGSSRRKRPRNTSKPPRALAVTYGRQEGLEIPLGQPITIGRSSDSILVLDDDYVSTHHVTIDSDGEGGWYVSDHGSTNGTYINDLRITAPTSFGPADTMRIGRTLMRLVS